MTWKGIDYNERQLHNVRNGLVGIVIDGIEGVYPGRPDAKHLGPPMSPEHADKLIERARRVLADFEGQKPPGGTRGEAYRWLKNHTDELRRLLSNAERARSGGAAVREAFKYPKPKPPEHHVAPQDGVEPWMIEAWNNGDAYRTGALRALADAGLVRYDKGWYPTTAGKRRGLKPRQRIDESRHVVADFNTVEDLVDHAARELGATHAIVNGPETRIFFPRQGQYPYEEARVWRKGGYWHAEGPGSRAGVRGLPRGAVPIGAAPPSRRHAAEARRNENPLKRYSGPFKWAAYFESEQPSGFRWFYGTFLPNYMGATLGAPGDQLDGYTSPPYLFKHDPREDGRVLEAMRASGTKIDQVWKIKPRSG